MHATEILNRAAETMQQRGKENTYDKSNDERSAATIAAIYSAASGKPCYASDAWLMLVSLKLARMQAQLRGGGNVEDTIVDLVAYCALLGEELTK